VKAGDADPGSSSGASGQRWPPVRKSLGQHFLADVRILARIADALEPQREDVVLEIGSGRGALTDLLVERVAKVIAIEYDRALAAQLRARYATRPEVSVVQADVLQCDLPALAGGPFKLVGNVPYYITTPIIFQALRLPRPRVAVYLVQREVAERIVAQPGADEYGALSLNVQALANAELLFNVAAGSFQPPPKVDSAVIRIIPRAEPVVPAEDEDRFRTFVQAAFGMRRKQMVRVVREVVGTDADSARAWLAAADIDPTARVETLDGARIARLLRAARGEG
jgi:16S rRNA (adenine1518-N6/adenine1519-N6)-dimethyltransferase